MPIMEIWGARKSMDFPNYSPDSWGPEDAEALIARDGHNWISMPPKIKRRAMEHTKVTVKEGAKETKK
jgi:hypothetical protein